MCSCGVAVWLVGVVVCRCVSLCVVVCRCVSLWLSLCFVAVVVVVCVCGVACVVWHAEKLPCVDAKRLRVYIHNVPSVRAPGPHVRYMSTWCQHTRVHTKAFPDEAVGLQ